MVRFIQTVGLFLVFALGVGRSESATVSDVSRSSYSKEEFAILRLQGEIVTGDASKVRAAIARLRPIDRIAIELDSPGGNYAEGLALAKLFRNEQVTTVVRNDKLCLSSCAIAFLGGARGRSGEARMMRLVEPRAQLGYHAPYLDLPKSNAHSNEEIAAAFRVSIDMMNELVDLAERLHIHLHPLPPGRTRHWGQLPDFYSGAARRLDCLTDGFCLPRGRRIVSARSRRMSALTA